MGTAAEIRITRGGHLESTHRVHAVVVSGGQSLLEWGDRTRLAFMRSSAKPLQSLPLVEDGVLESFGLSDEAVVLATASHNSESIHVEGVRAMLRAIGASEAELECGGHAPLDAETADARTRAGERFSAIDSNCSGKHAGMLAMCRHHGWASEGYRLPGHPVQERISQTISEWTGLARADVATAVDGCGVPCFGVPLHTMAKVFARYARESRDPVSGAGRITGAIRRFPELLAGRKRLCTDIVTVTEGRVLAKIGAEAVYSAWIPDDGHGRSTGVGIKVEDGGRRAIEVALVGVLKAAGLLSAGELEALPRYVRPAVSNTRGEIVGEIVFEAGTDFD